jgi:4-amino-4-deoxy-L-arabinose transferase-like glycosyltransferase
MPARKLFGLWLMALVPLLIFLDGAPVQRTQEARVLETARQMLGHGVHGWLIFSLNGDVRLRKPPLAYWMAAASFKLFGVSESAGRLPTALMSWLLLGTTYAIATRLFGSRAGLFSAAVLLSSYLFARSGRLAETDLPAAFFATIAVDFFWRAVEGPSAMLFHLAAVATGLSFFAKQGPGFFALLFFIGFALVRRRPKVLLKFVISLAPVTLLIVAGWWYAYAAIDQGMNQFRHELAEVTEGIDHPATFLVYFPWTAMEVAPWTLLVIGGLAAAARRARSDPKLAGLLIWALAVFVPLCCIGNKQEHYLLPLMPPVMILAGWLLAEATTFGADAKPTATVGLLIGITIIASIIAPVIIPIAAYRMVGHVRPVDIEVAAGIAVASVWTLWVLRKRNVTFAALTLAVVWAFSLPTLVDVWGPTIDPSDIRVTAAQIKQQFGDGPYVFFGGQENLPLCFAMRTRIVRLSETEPDVLTKAAQDHPGLAVVWQVGQRQPEPNYPPGFQQVGTDFGSRGQRFRIYQLKGSP